MGIDGSRRPMQCVCAAVRLLPCARTRRYTMMLSMLLLLVAALPVAAASEQLDTTIEHLISYVQTSGVSFRRNFSQHNSIEASEHIEKKYRHFHDDIDTPEEFIALCATRSLVTGRDYLIITTEGEKIAAGVWLNTELNRYRVQQGIE